MAMNLTTLLEAAKYIELGKEDDKDGKAREAKPTERKDHHYTKNNKDVKISRKRTSSAISSSSNEATPVKVQAPPTFQRRPGGAGTRETHNKLEKNRRAHLKDCFETLKKNVPNLDDKKTSNLAILRSALRYIQLLKRRDKEYELETQRLAKIKIESQERISVLKRELTAMNIDVDIIMRANEEEAGSDTTDTASDIDPIMSDAEEGESYNSQPAINGGLLNGSTQPDKLYSNIKTEKASQSPMPVLTKAQLKDMSKPIVPLAEVLLQQQKDAQKVTVTHILQQQLANRAAQQGVPASSAPQSVNQPVLAIKGGNIQTLPIIGLQTLQGSNLIQGTNLAAVPSSTIPLQTIRPVSSAQRIAVGPVLQASSVTTPAAHLMTTASSTSQQVSVNAATISKILNTPPVVPASPAALVTSKADTGLAASKASSSSASSMAYIRPNLVNLTPVNLGTSVTLQGSAVRHLLASPILGIPQMPVVTVASTNQQSLGQLMAQAAAVRSNVSTVSPAIQINPKTTPATQVLSPMTVMAPAALPATALTPAQLNLVNPAFLKNLPIIQQPFNLANMMKQGIVMLNVPASQVVPAPIAPVSKS